MPTDLRRLLLGVAATVLAVSLSGCAAPAPVVQPSPTTTSDQAAELETRQREEAELKTRQRQDRVRICSDFKTAMDKFLDATGVDNVTQEQYVAALQTLAYTMSDIALSAGDTVALQLDVLVADLATGSAQFADELEATGDTSTTRWLAFQTSVKAIASPCGAIYEFQNE